MQTICSRKAFVARFWTVFHLCFHRTFEVFVLWNFAVDLVGFPVRKTDLWWSCAFRWRMFLYENCRFTDTPCDLRTSFRRAVISSPSISPLASWNRTRQSEKDLSNPAHCWLWLWDRDLSDLIFVHCACALKVDKASWKTPCIYHFLLAKLLLTARVLVLSTRNCPDSFTWS